VPEGKGRDELDRWERGKIALQKGRDTDEPPALERSAP